MGVDAITRLLGGFGEGVIFDKGGIRVRLNTVPDLLEKPEAIELKKVCRQVDESFLLR